MFGKNKIVGKQYFENAGDKLLVTSIFMTLQGEGPYSGIPAVFVRLAYCNLNCRFCDTYFDSGDWMTIADIEQKIEECVFNYFNGNVPNWAELNPARRMVFVLTGGEPTLQKNIVSLLSKVSTQFEYVQVESNGILYQELPALVTLVVSPKCKQKNDEAVSYIKPLEKVLDRADCLKFVISADPSSPYSEVPEWALAWRYNNEDPWKKEIYVSPMNIYNQLPSAGKKIYQEKHAPTIDKRSREGEILSFWEPGLLNMVQNRANHEYAAQYAMKHGLYLSLQQHIYASLP